MVLSDIDPRSGECNDVGPWPGECNDADPRIVGLGNAIFMLDMTPLKGII